MGRGENQIISVFFRDRLYKAAALLLFGAVLIRTAWLAEDAFITFRTIDNFVHGYGLTWNVAERVQAYSNPLWMFLVVPFYWLSGEIYYTVVLLSVGVSLAALWVCCTRFAASGPSALLAGCVLVCSKAFTDYSTSGLENPLTHLLLALFYALYLDRWQRRETIFWLALLAALATVNRLDAILLFAPALGYALWWHRGGVAVCGLGFAPLVLWELFSLVYYGFPFPNTAYAKLGTGVPFGDRLSHGVAYLLNSLRVDLLTPLATAAGLVAAGRSRDRAAWALAAGGVLYLLYVVYIGGDFMSGRFLAAPFWGAVILGFHCFDVRRPRVWVSIFCTSVAAAMWAPHTPFLSSGDYAPGHGIAAVHMDERGKFYQSSGLLPKWRKEADGLYPDHWWARRASAVRQGNLRPELRSSLWEGSLVVRSTHDSTVVAAWSAIGYSGFFAGPGVHIVDPIALPDPLLARLPARDDPDATPGHFRRIMPEGYLETHITGVNQLADPGLKRYYDALLVVVRGDLVSRRRFSEIWRLNTGAYDDLIDRDFYRYPSPIEFALSEVRMEPGNPESHFGLAWEYFKLQDDERAIDALNDAIELNPASFLNFTLAGKMLDSQDYGALAEAAFRQALRNSEAHVNRLQDRGDGTGLSHAYAELANIHLRLRDPGFAEEVARLYLEVLADKAPVADGDLYRRMGAFFRAVGMEAESEASYRLAAGR